MESPGPPPSPASFSDFPEDLQLSILSFLRPADLAAFACTSRRSAALCAEPRLWAAMCDRRWGSKTLIRRWATTASAADSGGNPFDVIYGALDRWEGLIGFWRRIGRGAAGTPPLVLFEWGASCITGSRVSPSQEPGSYGVVKTPFLWIGLSPGGHLVSFVLPACGVDSMESLEKLASGSGFSDSDLVPVTVSFMGSNHFVVEEDRSCCGGARGGDEFGSSDDLMGLEESSSSPPDRVMAEIYQYFANRTSPGGVKAFRKQRKKGRDRLGKRGWEAEHFVKIANCCPSPTRPLQGLWKGIWENMSLDFYLVTYDEAGGIACRKVGDASEPFSGYSPIFWTSNTTFLELSMEEADLFEGREHIQPLILDCTDTGRVVSRILCINSSYDLVVSDSSGSFTHPQNAEGRIWEYDTGTFGFGFLRNNYIVDLKHIAKDGCLLDIVDPLCKGPCL